MSPLDHARRKAVVTCSAPAADEAAADDAVAGKAVAGTAVVDWDAPALPLPGAALTVTMTAITTAATTAAMAASDAATMMPVRGRRGGSPCSANPAAKTSYPS